MIKPILTALFSILISEANAQFGKCEYKTYYFPDGSLKAEGCLKYGLRDGLWKDYTKGKNIVRFIWTFESSVQDGPYIALYANGKIEAIGRYTYGSLDDTLKHFDTSGNLSKITIWKGDSLCGSSKLLKTIKLSNLTSKETIEFIDGIVYIKIEGIIIRRYNFSNAYQTKSKG